MLASHVGCRGRISPGNQHFCFLPRTLCVWQRCSLCCIVCINRAYSKSLNAKWLVEEGETYHMDSHRTLECSICGGFGNLNPLSLTETDHNLV